MFALQAYVYYKMSMSIGEEWRAIPGWEGFYEASSDGRVRSLDRVIAMHHPALGFRDRFFPGKPMSPQDWGDGYKSVSLSKCGQKRHVGIHILVCLAFYGERPKDAHAAHGNGNPSDNRASNLRWASPKENAADRVAHGTVLRGLEHPARRLTEAQVVEIRASTGSLRAIAEAFRICPEQARRIKSLSRWGHLIHSTVGWNPEPVSKGAKNGNAQLTEADALAIISDPRPVEEVAASYGISHTHVVRVRRGRAWKHLQVTRPARRKGGTVGERHHAAKLNEDHVRKIRASAGSLRELAAQFGVTPELISQIRRHKAWRHIE